MLKDPTTTPATPDLSPASSNQDDNAHEIHRMSQVSPGDAMMHAAVDEVAYTVNAGYQVNMQYQYDEADIENAINAQIALDKNGYLDRQERSYTFGYDLIIGSGPEVGSKIDRLQEALKALLQVGAQHRAVHSFIIPLNLRKQFHWILGEVRIQFAKENTNAINQVQLYTYDSIPRNIDKQREIITPFLNLITDMFSYLNINIRIDACAFNTPVQPDTYCCGVIVAEHAVLIADGGDLRIERGSEKFTVEEVEQMRRQHIDVLGVVFAKKQFDNQVVTLKAKDYTLSHESRATIADKILELIKSDANARNIFTAYYNVEHDLDQVNTLPGFAAKINHAQLTVDSLQASENLKKWFAQNYAQHQDMFNVFFQPWDGKDDLRWQDGAKDTLFIILRAAITTYEYTCLKQKQAQQPQEYHQGPTLYINPSDHGPKERWDVVEYLDASEAQPAEFKHEPKKRRIAAEQKGFHYFFDGYINERGLADGNGIEKYADKYIFNGYFANGVRALGMEKHYVMPGNHRYELSFYGTYGKDGNFSDGVLHGLVGAGMSYDGLNWYVTYKGHVSLGQASEFGEISYLGAEDGKAILVNNDNRMDSNISDPLATILFKHYIFHKKDLRLQINERQLTWVMDTMRRQSISSKIALDAMDAAEKQQNVQKPATATTQPAVPDYII